MNRKNAQPERVCARRRNLNLDVLARNLPEWLCRCCATRQEERRRGDTHRFQSIPSTVTIHRLSRGLLQNMLDFRYLSLPAAQKVASYRGGHCKA